MKTLELTKEETKDLLKDGSVEITRDGIDILVEKHPYEDDKYNIYVINPYEDVKLYPIKKINDSPKVVEETAEEYAVTFMRTEDSFEETNYFGSLSEAKKSYNCMINEYDLEYVVLKKITYHIVNGKVKDYDDTVIEGSYKE